MKSALGVLVVVVSTASAAPPKIVVVDANTPEVLAAAKAVFEPAGFTVVDGAPIEDAFGVSFVFGRNGKPPAALPVGAADRWKRADEACRTQAAACPFVEVNDECGKLFDCSHEQIPGAREAWLRALGAVAWVHVHAEPTSEDTSHFFGKAWGNAICEPYTRGLRSGRESTIMTVGKDAPAPATLAAAARTAAQLGLRVVKGAGERHPRAIRLRELPADPAAAKKVLGCD